MRGGGGKGWGRWWGGGWRGGEKGGGGGGRGWGRWGWGGWGGGPGRGGGGGGWGGGWWVGGGGEGGGGEVWLSRVNYNLYIIDCITATFIWCPSNIPSIGLLCIALGYNLYCTGMLNIARCLHKIFIILNIPNCMS